MVIGGYEIPEGYKYLGCVNNWSDKPIPLFDKFCSGKYKSRVINIDRHWSIHICDDLKICWDVNNCVKI